MIEVIQAGQAGKTRLLLEMHRLRAKIFKDRMGWDVDVDMAGLETDDFDTDEAIYFLYADDHGAVTGSWRIIPTSNPTMIEKVWPDFLEDIDLRKSPLCWEMSRFGVLTDERHTTKENLYNFNHTTAEMFCGLTELCILCGVEEIYTLYTKQIAKLLRRLDCQPEQVSRPRPIDGEDSYVGRFIPDRSMLFKLRRATGINRSLIDTDDLPSGLQLRPQSRRKDEVYVVAS